jgi:selenocysteine lyase/cysteine desulfurase
VIDGAHAQDIATLLDQEAVCVRSGHHCTQPLLARLGVTATVRASFGPFNRREDVDRLVEALRKALKILSL